MVKEGQRHSRCLLRRAAGSALGTSGASRWSYLYPRDLTPGCTSEACAVGDLVKRMQRSAGFTPARRGRGARGVRSLPVPPDIGDKTRSAFLIDGEGVVRKVFPKVRVDGHAQEVRAALSTL